MMYSETTLFISLGLGYALCVLAKKQSGALKTLGYTLGAGILAFSLVSAVIVSTAGHCGYGRMYGKGNMSKMRKMDKMRKMGKKGCPIMKMPGGMKNPAPMTK